MNFVFPSSKTEVLIQNMFSDLLFSQYPIFMMLTFLLQVALIVAHTRDRKNQLSPLLMNYLSDALEKIYHVAKETGASVHFPLIGYNTPNFNWYGTERLIKKILTQRQIPTFVYYYKRRNAQTNSSLPSNTNNGHLNLSSNSSQAAASSSLEETLTSRSSELEERPEDQEVALLNIFSKHQIAFHGFTDENEIKRLTRYVIAYDGDVDNLSDDTTHLVCAMNSNVPLLEDASVHTKFVRAKWIEDCVKEGRILDEKFYSVT